MIYQLFISDFIDILFDQLCEDYLVSTLDQHNACDRIQAAQTYRLDGLKRKTLEFIEDNTFVSALICKYFHRNYLWYLFMFCLTCIFFYHFFYYFET